MRSDLGNLLKALGRLEEAKVALLPYCFNLYKVKHAVLAPDKFFDINDKIAFVLLSK